MENRKRISIYDYPEHLNPFSDRYMSPFAPRYLHKNKTWSSKLSKKLNRSVSWIEKSLFTADENGRNDRDNLSAGNQENGTTSADKRTVPNGDCPSPLREPVHMERESEDKSSTTVRNQNNHVRPPIRRRKKKAPLPPHITDDSISLAGDSANESLVQENNSFEIGEHVEEKREPEEKSDKRVINDTTNQIYVEKCEVTTISEVNNNRIVSSTTVIVNKQEEPSNDDKLSEDRTQSSDNVSAAVVVKDVRSEDVEKTNHDVAAIIVDNDKVNHENKLSRERIYDDESTCEAAEGIKNEIVHQNDVVTLTYDDDKVDLFSAEPTSSSSSVETENADKQKVAANAQQQITADGEEENINHDETKKKDESEKPDHHHHVEKTENLQEDLPGKITTTLLLLHNKTEGGENLKTTNGRSSQVLTNDSNNSKLDNNSHHASIDSNSHDTNNNNNDNISTGIESKESESRLNDDASRLVNNNIVISVN